MQSYEYTKAQGMETILNGVKVLATTHNHGQCKTLIMAIKSACDGLLALEDLASAYERGDIEGMLRALPDHGIPDKGEA